MQRNEILAVVPYGEPFMFIDVAEQTGPRGIVTRFTWTQDRPEILAHFKHGPRLVPATLLIEQAAQSALLLAVNLGYLAPGNPMLLGRIRCDMVGPARVPCTVCSSVEVDAIIGSTIGFRATCAVDDRPVAKLRGIASAMPPGQ